MNRPEIGGAQDDSSPTPKKYEQLDQNIGPGNVNSEMKRRKSGELGTNRGVVIPQRAAPEKILQIDFNKNPRESGHALTEAIR